jgi:peptidoglycan biosynthesis protein MviN/MurJ (putative lipid II flippase)
VKVAAGAVALNIALSLILMRTGLSFGGLALANSLAALVEATTLTMLLNRHLGWVTPGEFLSFGWRIGLAAVTMGVMAILLQDVLAPHLDSTHWLGQTALVLTVTAAAGLTYVGLTHLLGVQDARRVASILLRR